jgi:tetratricopeptide (TPR) repeat protein
MKIIITFFLLLTVKSMHSQTLSDFEKYDLFAWKAMLQYKAKDYKSALDNFKKAFKIIPNDSENDYFYAAAAALHLNNDKEAEKLIIKSIKLMNTSKDYFLNFEEFTPYRSRKLFKKISNDYEKYKAIFFTNLAHPEIYKEIDSLFIKDQEVRNNGGKMHEIDTNNINRLLEITKEYGWQKKGWILLWHQSGTYGESNGVWDFFKPYIDEQIKNGKMRKDFWARFEDQKSIDKNKKQIYGLYWSQYDEWPIIDIENVDKRRESVGLPPLWYMSKVYGINPPKEYKNYW